ncbi:MAG: sulfatase [Gemmatimonadota bacterium]
MTDRPADSARSPKRIGSREVLWIGLWFGLWTGLLEAALLLLEHVLLDRIVFVNRWALWMAPAAGALLFVALGLILVAAGRWVRPLASGRAAVYLFGFLAAENLFLLYPPLHPLARLALAAGVGTQAARLLVSRRRLRHTVVRRTVPWLAACVLGLGLGQSAWQMARQRTAERHLASAPDRAPNVLLIILDTVRASSTSVGGSDRPTTPNLERVAREGVYFRRAISTAPWTLPSHASLFTGRPAHALSASWRRPLDSSFPTLAEFLAAHGYRTAGFVANLGYCGWESGLARGFMHYEDQPISLPQLGESLGLFREWVDTPLVHRLLGSDQNWVRKSAAQVTDAFLGWLPRSSAHPFFAFLNYYDAHAPYMPPEPFRSRFAEGPPRGGLSPLHRWTASPLGPPPSPAEVRAERDAYDASIAYMDHHIGRLLDALRRTGVLDHTLLIIASDHGEEFGEHGLYDHGNSLYIEGIHVPLFLSLPGRLPKGVVVDGAVSLRSLPATIARLTGLEEEMPFPGPSLSARWDGSANAPPVSEDGPAYPAVLSEVEFAPRLPDWFPVSRGDMRSIVLDDRHYILNGDGTEELYDLAEDPSERTDLTGRAGARGGIETLRRALRSALDGGP